MKEVGYSLLYSLPLCLIAAFLSADYLPGEENRLLYLLTSIFTTVILTLLTYLRGRKRNLVAACVAAFFAGLFLTKEPGTRLAYLKDHRWLFLGILLFAGCFLLAGLLVRFRIFGIFLGIAGLAYLITCMVMRRSVEKAVVLLVLFFITLVIADERQRRTPREGDTDPKKHLLGVVLFLMVAFAVPAFVRPPENPIDWSFIREWSEAFKSRYAVLKQFMFHSRGWDETQSTIGFSDRASVGSGELTKNGYRVMELQVEKTGEPVIYLAGGYFDTFDGNEWRKEKTPVYDERTLDILETTAAFLHTKDEVPLNDRMRRINAEITYHGLRTSVLFAPSKLIAVKENRRTKVVSEGADIRFSKRRKTGDPYLFSYYRLNRDDEDFIRMLETENDLTREDWMNAVTYCSVSEGFDFSYEDYLAWEDAVHQKDGAEVTLSPQLRAFLDALSEGAESDYETLGRIESFLQSLDYSETPGIPAGGFDDPSAFLDSFLLEKKKGYCSHFATAFVLLARASGIPARYVEGYRVPMGKENNVWVESTMAHAWPEVYFDGIGWIPFEPTPGYLVNESWAHTKKFDPEAAKAGFLNRPQEEAPEADVEETQEDKPGDLPDGKKFLLYGLLFLAFILVVLGIAALQDRIRYQRLSETEKARFLCRRHLEFLRLLGAGRMTGETLSEFSGRLGKEYPEIPELSAMFSLYERILYARDPVSRKDRMFLENSRDSLRTFLLNSLIRIRMFRRKSKSSL